MKWFTVLSVLILVLINVYIVENYVEHWLAWVVGIVCGAWWGFVIVLRNHECKT